MADTPGMAALHPDELDEAVEVDEGFVVGQTQTAYTDEPQLTMASPSRTMGLLWMIKCTV